MNESEFRAKHQAAADALFALECVISRDDVDPTRKSVYRLRVALGNIANNVLREGTAPSVACKTCDGSIADRLRYPLLLTPELPAIVNAYVDNESNLVLLRNDGGSSTRAIRPAEFVTYHHRSDLTPEKRRLIEREDGFHTAKYGEGSERDWYRIAWSNYVARRYMVETLCDKYKLTHYEADVHPVRRYLVDSGARIQKPRRAFLDIETDSRLSFARLRQGEGRVLCWTVVNETGKATTEVLQANSDAAERDLLVKLLECLQNFDQVVAWNGDGFDFPVLKGDRRTKGIGRFKRLGINVDPRRWLWLDHLALFRRMNLQVAESGDEKQSFKLQDIAMSMLGQGKDDFDSSKCWDAWKNDGGYKDREALARYNARDTDLLRRLEEKTGYCAILDTICDACGALPDSRGMRPLNQLDPFMLRLGLARGMHFPTVTRFEEEEDRKKFKGADVMAPTFKGVSRNVHVCDFKSLYPTIIISWNMSPETKVVDSRGSMGPISVGCARAPGTGVMFRTDVPGILPLAVDRLLFLRSDWKKKKGSSAPGTPEWLDADRKSNAYKVCSNSFFGATGNEFSRFFDVDVAESITRAGAYLIREIESRINFDKTWNVGYLDTDGAYLSGDPDRARFGRYVKEVLNGQVIPSVLSEFGCKERRVAISYEKQFDRICFTGAKKRYFGRYLHYEGTDALLDSKPEIKGLEFKRGDTSKPTRRLQERIIRMILGDWEPTCVSCRQACKGDGEAPKGRMTALLYTCPSCGVREDAELSFARPTENVEAYRAIVAKARDWVLTAKLSRDMVSISKTLTMPIDDYVQKKKQDGEDAAQSLHVQVARVLAARGAEVAAGTKISYVVIDGAETIKAIPADDYAGEADRFYLWEHLVWPPIERVLAAALPGTPWEQMFGKVRPPKEKPPKRGGAAPGQLKLFDASLTKKFAPIRVKVKAGAMIAAPTVPGMRRRAPVRVKVKAGSMVAPMPIRLLGTGQTGAAVMSSRPPGEDDAALCDSKGSCEQPGAVSCRSDHVAVPYLELGPLTKRCVTDVPVSTLFYGDNLDVLRKRIKDERIDLCYIDPPFNSKRNYNQIYNNIGVEDRAQAQAFSDTWSWNTPANEGFAAILDNEGGRFRPQTIDLIKGLRPVLKDGAMLAYLVSMTLRITEIHRVLKPTGSFYMHCDPKMSHYLKLVLDTVFCSQGGDFVNEIIWHYTGGGRSKRYFSRKHDVIFWYSKGSAARFNLDAMRVPYKETSGFAKGGITSKAGKKYEPNPLGTPVDDVWDIPIINPLSKERLGYPTQKPELLLERIIQASTNIGDVVLDAYCGCGTTVDVAQRLGREWIGIDITYQSISLVLRRLEGKAGINWSTILKTITVDGIPRDMESVVALAHKKDDRLRKEFEKWAVLTYTNNRGAIHEKKGADSGIDGVAYFRINSTENASMVIQVKSGGVSRGDVAKLRGDMAREGAVMATLITLEQPTGPMITEAKSAGQYHHDLMGRNYDCIQIVTAQEIIEGNRRLDLPMSLEVVKKAQAHAGGSDENDDDE